jgi:hypothetical protein
MDSVCRAHSVCSIGGMGVLSVVTVCAMGESEYGWDGVYVCILFVSSLTNDGCPQGLLARKIQAIPAEKRAEMRAAMDKYWKFVDFAYHDGRLVSCR